ncbi:LuxR C-terminal-related transcriptional regulator [Serratia sp. NPDC078593]|uniref:LuxR C-terminal-related transcriptional regulator n=1 Tax=unclassified Serratia (in: enterobacteria) TaxID=2647522 RepID=UPI0037CF5330
MTAAHTYQRITAHTPNGSGQKGQGVIIMEACPMTTLGMRNVLAQSCGLSENIMQVNNLAAIPGLMRNHLPQLLIMELCGEAESVLDGLRLISLCIEHWPATPIIVCTALDDPRVLQLLTASGIKGLLLKQEPSVALAQCVQQVLAGRRSYSHKVRQLLANHSIGGKALTARELDVLAYLFSGKSVTTAALMMHRDVRTVSTHKRNAMLKLGFQNDGELFLQGKWMAKTGPVFSR